MKTILLAGYRSTDDEAQPLGLKSLESGRSVLQSQIAWLKQLSADIVCVVSGAAADDQLRHCPQIASVELAFDDSPTGQLSLASNLRAGLAVVPEGEPCYILPVEVPPPPLGAWHFLKEGWRQHGIYSTVSLVQALSPQGAPWHYGFPLLLTPHGHKELRQAPEPRRLTDASLKYLQLVYSEEANLALDAQAL